MRTGPRGARVVSAVGVVAAVATAVLLLLRWGERPDDFGHTIQFAGTGLPSPWPLLILACAGVSALVGLVVVWRRFVSLLVILLEVLLMSAVLTVILIAWNDDSLFMSATPPSATWEWTSLPFVTMGLAGAGIAVWLGLALAAAVGKTCPDCAERTRWRSVNCPHCQYEFPIHPRLKRCEECRRPIKTEARVCRFCGHRFGTRLDTPETAATGVSE
jgi:hypothetical protein